MEKQKKAYGFSFDNSVSGTEVTTELLMLRFLLKR